MNLTHHPALKILLIADRLSERQQMAAAMVSKSLSMLNSGSFPKTGVMSFYTKGMKVDLRRFYKNLIVSSSVNL